MPRRDARYEKGERLTSGVAEHPAVVAWSKASPDGPSPVAVTPLKPQIKSSQKSGVYRLHGVGSRVSGDVVAKRCLRATAAVELEVCREILPRLPVSRLEYFATLDEGPAVGFTWLFMQDAGDDTCLPEDLRDVALWLAHVHGAATELSTREASVLGEGGVERYRAHLEHAREKVLAVLCQWRSGQSPPTSPDAYSVLHEMLRLLDRVEDGWQRVCEFAALIPRTLAHGDFVKKNVRVGHVDLGRGVVALDWETAGWGSPAADLASLSNMYPGGQRDEVLTAYASALQQRWPAMRVEDIRRTAQTGAVFRRLAAVDWACLSLGWGCDDRTVAKLSVYAPQLESAMQTVEMQ